MNNKILIVSDNQHIYSDITTKIKLSREILCNCKHKELRKTLTVSEFEIVILDVCNCNKDVSLKIIKNVKNIQDILIILYCNDADEELLKSGIYDYITPDMKSCDIELKIMNAMRYKLLQSTITKNNLYFQRTGILNYKNECYSLKYIKEIFSENLSWENGVFCVLTLDEQIKTKVSLNRLAGVIKKNVRVNDVVAEDKNGLFYIVFENCQIQNISTILQNIYQKMGEEFIIHAGLCKIELSNFDETLKNALDGLKAAIKNNELCVCINDNIYLQDNSDWFDEKIQNKSYKLFLNAYNNKLKNVVEHVFFRFQKDNEKNFDIIQYTNKSETTFCIKKDNQKSEIILQFDGLSGVNVDLVHHGLNSAENDKLQIPLNKFNENELLKILKRLKTEFIQSL